MVYTESIRGYPYMRKEQLTKEFQISAGTVRTRLFEIEDEIKTGRYNDYAIIRDHKVVLPQGKTFGWYLQTFQTGYGQSAETIKGLHDESWFLG